MSAVKSITSPMKFLLQRDLLANLADQPAASAATGPLP